MILENIKENENIKPNSRDIEQLRMTMPYLFDKDGNFLFDRLKKVLKESNITINKEGYELNFLGKSYARYLSSTKTETFISPHTEENEKEENKNSENMYIIGDNLDALKHLLDSYAGKIKCIYIDPPYNTGSDGFVYNDNFYFDEKKLSEMLGVEEEEAQRIIDLKGKSSHSAWLTFMYPRLILARELLSDDGVIFISIDDNEQANLKLICDEIFGEENFVSNSFVLDNLKGKTNDNFITSVGSNLYVYMKNKEFFLDCDLSFNKIENIFGKKTEEKYNKEDNDGFYALTTFKKTGQESLRENRPFMWYPILEKDNIIFSIENEEYEKLYDKENKKFNDNYIEELKIKYSNYNFILPLSSKGDKLRWTSSFNTFLNNKNKEIVYENGNVYSKSRPTPQENLQIYSSGTPKSLMYKPSYTLGTQDFEEFFEKDIFDFPKPLNLIKDITKLLKFNNNDIILDFFSGSATTAHAVMQLNAENAQKSGGGA